MLQNSKHKTINIMKSKLLIMSAVAITVVACAKNENVEMFDENQPAKSVQSLNY